MKKSRKKLYMVLGVLIIFIIIIAVIYVYPFFSMKPTPTGIVEHTEVFALKNNINSLYFIKSTDGYILIDAGTNRSGVEKALAKENIDPSDIKHIFLTHTDSDHVASLSLFPNARIYMSEDELQMLDGTVKRSGNRVNSLPDHIDLDNGMYLRDEQELIIGTSSIKCFVLPGHTLGSMAYLIDGNYLFSGDAVKISNHALFVHPFSMDRETSEESIKKLREIAKDSQFLFTAHYGDYKVEDLELE